MSEEEIIHCIELCIETKGMPSEGIYWVKGLLDLYYKQKEDIMYLRTDIQELADDLELWQDRCDDSVDKDDMRNKIAELEDKIEQCRKEYGNNTNEDYNWYLAQKRILEEMVKEY